MGDRKSLNVAAALIAAGLVLASLIYVVGNRYSISTGEGNAYRIDRITGQISYCSMDACRVARELPQR